MKQLLVSAKFYSFATRMIPWLSFAAFLFIGYGLIAGLFFAPIDYQQQEAFKIIYIHVPCAIMSLTIYTIIGFMSFLYLVWKIKIADVIAAASAPLGASLTLLALVSGSLWGKPMWGTWWVWDARLTSELILLFLYAGYIGLRAAIRDQRVAAKVCALLGIIGVLDIPIIHFSVEWWHTLHQSASITRFAKPAIAAAMLYPLLSCIVGLYLIYALCVCLQGRHLILWRERKTEWVKNLLRNELEHAESK